MQKKTNIANIAFDLDVFYMKGLDKTEIQLQYQDQNDLENCLIAISKQCKGALFWIDLDSYLITQNPKCIYEFGKTLKPLKEITSKARKIKTLVPQNGGK